MVLINKAYKLSKMIEDLIDPQSPYPAGPVSNAGLNPREREWSNSTHHKLVKEAMRHTDQMDKENPEGEAISSYSGGGYAHINNHLRHNTDINPVYKSHSESLKKLTKNTTEHTFTAYRGAKEKLFDHTPGTLFKDRGFTSTSLRPSIANRFSNYKNDKSIYRIHIKPGTKGHYISGHVRTGSDAEREFVLHPGTTFRVGDKHQHESGETYTDLHIHSQDD